MPSEPIDQANSVASIRLKVPTGTVPIPPAGYVQLHAPNVDGLALRQHDGSVTEIGGGGGVGTALENERGLVTVEAVGEEPQAVTIYAKPGSDGHIKLSGNVIDSTNDEQFPHALTLVQRSDPPSPPSGGRLKLWLDVTSAFRVIDPDGAGNLELRDGSGGRVVLSNGFVTLAGAGGSYFVQAQDAFLQVRSPNGNIYLDPTDLTVDVAGGHLKLIGLPAVDPGVAGRCWRDPVTGALMVSDGP